VNGASTDSDAPRLEGGRGANDTVTVAFAQAGSELCGLARLGIAAPEEPGPPQASGLVVLFHEGRLVTVAAEGSIPCEAPSSWEEVRAAGLSTGALSPGPGWSVDFGGAHESFALELEALGEPGRVENPTPGREPDDGLGEDSLCRVRGSVQIADSVIDLDCLGQRVRSSQALDWRRVELTRQVSAWMDDGLAVSLTATRPDGARAHAEETVRALLVEGRPPTSSLVSEARLSSTYDDAGRQRRASLELWPAEDSDFPRRVAGTVVCGTSLELGRLRLECAFFRWWMEGREGRGRYDVLRRA